METAIAENPILKEVPSRITNNQILTFLFTKEIDWRYVTATNNVIFFDDKVLSNWLNISEETFGEYKKPGTKWRENVKEHLLLLLSLFKHGTDVFGEVKLFNEWLSRENFFFDKKQPITFLNTVAGIRFIDDRLTGMEYGDNV